MSLVVRAYTWLLLGPTPAPDRIETDTESGAVGDRDRGQATTEYALVMLAAALVALLVVAWATAGGGAGKVGRLFDRILDEVISRI
jgi:hypothetical protein